MIYTRPDYYDAFSCIANQCEDTCCAGWQIVIDDVSFERYQREKRAYRDTLRNGINRKKHTFCQKDGRCAFLRDDNLCDLYLNLGADSLCNTCKSYPRHTEEFENVREISLSVSCPEVARLLLEQKNPVTFLTEETAEEEEYGEFDLFLYSKLWDAREELIGILQNRKLAIADRCILVLGIAHDMQIRIDKGMLFSCDEVFLRYRRKNALHYIRECFRQLNRDREYTFLFTKSLYRRLYWLEHLKSDWEDLLVETEALLYAKGSAHYDKLVKAFLCWQKKHMPDFDIYMEQLLVYFIFTYFCGAVYDQRVYAKAQLAVASVFYIREFIVARWLKNDRCLDKEDLVEIIYRFSRELEHSDQNLELLESLMEKQSMIALLKLVAS